METLDGKTLQGRIRLGDGQTLSVTPPNTPPVQVALANLRRADFAALDTASARPDNAHLARGLLDEHRGALPAPWRRANLGPAKKPGAAAHYHGTFTIEAPPLPRVASADSLVFIHQPWHGDGEFIARVASLAPRDAKENQPHAGLLLRTSLETDSASVSMSLTGGRGSVFRRKSRKGEKVIDDRRPDLKPPYWVKIVREGGATAGFQSTDGRHWKLIGSSETDLPERILVGLAVGSRRRERALATLDHVTLLSLVPRASYAPRLVLRDGTVLVDHFASMEEASVMLSKAKRNLKLRTADVARVLFQPEFEANAITAGRAGLLFSNGDFIDGEFRGIEAGQVTISSVLLGQRRYELNRKVAAVRLREVTPSPALFEVATLDGSLWRSERIAFEKDALVLATPWFGEWRVPADELLEIRRHPDAASR